MAQVVLAADTAVVRAMQAAVDAIKVNVHARPVARCDDSAKRFKQRFDLPPVNVATDRLLENRIKNTLVLLTHGVMFSGTCRDSIDCS